MGYKDKVESDVLVIGGGLAGLFAGLRAAEERHVILVTESGLTESNSWWAQGGIAASLDEDDTAESHGADTLRVGLGLNQEKAVTILAAEAPERIADLLRLGVVFDHEEDSSQPALGLEGGHSRRRILHAGGSATGRHIVDVLINVVRAHPTITVLERVTVTALLCDGITCYGAEIFYSGEQRRIVAGATILATGGACSLYSRTTNPPGALGTGIALAADAGALITDMEFVQFHPTALSLPGERAFLLSEALRGEGAVLVNGEGERFMLDRHPLADLAPRDVVAREIVAEMSREGSSHVFLDMRHLDPLLLQTRFANIGAHLATRGLDMTSTPIPVAPAAHYLMGGVETDNNGATSIERLFACGEVAWTGVHGANRLASNSLVECLVFGERAAYSASACSSLPSLPQGAAPRQSRPPTALPPEELVLLRALLSERVGIVREGPGLLHALSTLNDWRSSMRPAMQPLLSVASLMTRMALLREESRGAHVRRDFPRTDPLWQKHIRARRDELFIESDDVSASASSPALGDAVIAAEGSDRVVA